MDKRKRRLLCMLEGSGRKSRWISGAPPLQYSAKKQGTLKNYRIYGNTVSGESVGDRTGNLFDGELAQGYYRDVAGSSNNLISSDKRVAGVSFITVSAGSTMTLTYESTIDTTKYLIYYYNNNKELINVVGWIINGSTFTIPNNISFIRIVWGAKKDWASGIYDTLRVTNISNIMLNEGSTALPYEPYGYKVPIAVTNSGTTSNETIYLPEPIKMVGDEAEYIDYAEQKMHRIGADDVDVTLPALPVLPGTNVLSVGTAVQPSEIEVKGKIKDL